MRKVVTILPFTGSLPGIAEQIFDEIQFLRVYTKS
jgi:hypothetical protein